MINREKSSIVIILLALIIGVVFIVAASDKSKPTTPSPKAKVVKTKTVTLDNVVTATFPCLTDAVKLQGKTASNVSGYGADCAISVNKGSENIAFTAADEQFSPGSSEIQALFNYCSAQTSYAGPSSGTTIYILNPMTQTLDNTTFASCALSVDGTTSYEATARAVDGNYVFILNVDAAPSVSASSLLSYLQSFMSTVKIKQ